LIVKNIILHSLNQSFHVYLFIWSMEGLNKHHENYIMGQVYNTCFMRIKTLFYLYLILKHLCIALPATLAIF